MPVVYTREHLAEAAHASSSYDDAVRWFGRTPTPGRRQYLRARMREAGVDTTHFAPAGVRHTEARLCELVACSHSVAEVVRRLGISPVGGNQAHIGRRIAELGLDTGHFTAAPRRGPKAGIRHRLTLGSPADGRIGGRRLHRELLRRGTPEQCAMCRTGAEWNGGPLRLEVDHLNGDWWDNRPGNLRLLCPNCHAVTDTYRGRKRRR
ncbi:HNH endonuclease [Streptomyces angustmyceticus]|uniref:HNH endonuclease n=1 Tax=Streptomyces angustmyceticus TaxID=285578 RepID=UPI00344F2524